MVGARPAIAAMPPAIMAPQISPPGRFAHKNTAPPAVPITSVSSTLRVLMRLGMANAVDAGIWLTAPYGKSLHGGQMRQRDCSNACPSAASCRHAPRMRGIQYSEALRLNRNGRGLPDHPLEPVIGLAGDPMADDDARQMTPCNYSRRFRSLRLVGRRLLAVRHELLALLAVDALGIGFLRAFQRCCGPRLLGLLCTRPWGGFCRWSRRGPRRA